MSTFCSHCRFQLSDEKQDRFLHSLTCKKGNYKLSNPKAKQILILLVEVDLLKTDTTCLNITCPRCSENWDYYG